MLPILVDDTLYRENLSALQLDEQWLDALLQQHSLKRRQVLLLLYNVRRTAPGTKKRPPGTVVLRGSL